MASQDSILIPLSSALTPREQVTAALKALSPRSCYWHPNVILALDIHKSIQLALNGRHRHDYDYDRKPEHRYRLRAYYDRCADCPHTSVRYRCSSCGHEFRIGLIGDPIGFLIIAAILAGVGLQGGLVFSIIPPDGCGPFARRNIQDLDEAPPSNHQALDKVTHALARSI